MITTNVGAGNFFVKSKDPSKGWSEPIYLKKIDGIDLASSSMTTARDISFITVLWLAVLITRDSVLSAASNSM